MAQRRRRLALDPATRDDEIGRWLAAADEARARTLHTVRDIDREALDWPDAETGSVAALLYRIALNEAEWLFSNLLQVTMPARIARLLPFDVADVARMPPGVRGESVDRALGRLKAVREQTESVFSSMSLDEFRRARELPSHDPGTTVEATPEWVIHHLMQEEAEQRAAIRSTLARFRRQS